MSDLISLSKYVATLSKIENKIFNRTDSEFSVKRTISNTIRKKKDTKVCALDQETTNTANKKSKITRLKIKSNKSNSDNHSIDKNDF